uniref:G-protein coupled receptors family 1 profile domain-containing protein n=1 Tax=Oryctolagus cuniculus TaxID=9986 RepID=G1SVY2_RABIT
YMNVDNKTQISEFLLLGLSEDPELQPLIFGLFLFMYLVTVVGNLLIILAILSNPQLHTPMYFFLSNLSLVDICFTSTTVPKMLVNIQMQSQAISYAGCITQMFFFILFVGLDDFLLAVMAYDRFVAICHPLHYMVTMNPQLCVQLVLASWILSVLQAMLHSSMVLQLSFCIYLEIPHFFCTFFLLKNTHVVYRLRVVTMLISIICSTAKYENTVFLFYTYHSCLHH